MGASLDRPFLATLYYLTLDIILRHIIIYTSQRRGRVGGRQHPTKGFTPSPMLLCSESRRGAIEGGASKTVLAIDLHTLASGHAFSTLISG